MVARWLYREIAGFGSDVTDQFVLGPPGTDATVAPLVAVPEGSQPEGKSSRVFVVHGRNSDARDGLVTFLRSIGLQPTEWSEAVTATKKATPYVGEVLDAALSRAQAGVVLMTPDDLAVLRDELQSETDPPHETELTGQARPNVLFEAGMAMATDVDRTILIELGQIRPFSDIGGHHVLRMDNSTQRAPRTCAAA
jgi:predicted nucleotide-binding protein